MPEEKVVIVNQEKQKDSNTPALLGFIFSLLGCLAIPGLILSIIGLATCKDYKNGRKGLAIAGLIISALLIFLSVFLFLTDPSSTSNTSSYSYNNSSYANKGSSSSSSSSSSSNSSSGSSSSNSSSGSSSSGYTYKSPEEEKNEYIAACQSYSYDEISRNPDNYNNKKAKFEGQVVQIQEAYANSIILRVDVTKNEYDFWEDTVYVHYTYKDGESRILEDDIITMYGTLNGLKTYTTIFGASVTIPEFYAEYITINQ